MPATEWVIPEGPPSGFVEIPAGSFNMGQVLDGIHYSVPVHKVTLDKFYIGTHEVIRLTLEVADFTYTTSQSHGCRGLWNSVPSFLTHGEVSRPRGGRSFFVKGLLGVRADERT